MNKIFLIICMFYPLMSFSKNWGKVTVVTESTPPFVFLNDQHEVDGITARRVKKILKMLNIKSKIEIYPWARAYKMAIKQKNVLIFPLAKTPEREQIFKFAGVINNNEVFIYKLKSREDIVINTLDDAKKYVVCVVRDDVKHVFVVKNGFKNIQESDTSDAPVKKVFGDRCDIFLSNEIFVKNTIASMVGENRSYDQLEKMIKIEEIDGRRYMAFNSETSNELVEAFRNAAGKLDFSKD